MSEYGEVIVSRLHDPAIGRDRVRIDRADPRARIAVMLVAEIRDVRSDWARCTDDGVLTLQDDFGHRFIYQVDFNDYDPQTESFSMEWPD